MSANTSRMSLLFGLTLALIFMFCGATTALAQPCLNELVPCNISGMDSVMIRYPIIVNDDPCGLMPDPESTEGMDYMAGFDPDTGAIYVFMSGVPCFPMAKLLYSKEGGQLIVEMADAEPFRFTFSKPCGGRFYNQIDVDWIADPAEPMPVARTKMVDTDGDCVADRVEGLLYYLDGFLGTPILIDTALQYYPSAANPKYWLIPCEIELAPGFPLMSYRYIYIPVNAASKLLSITCGGFVNEAVTAEATMLSGGDCFICGLIPSVNHWGFGALALIILAAGIWTMRRSGFGRGLTKH